MAKIFRLHTNASTDLEGWKQSMQIDSSLIQHISDPSGGRAKKIATSIPTPLARMHLFRTAFEFVTKEGDKSLRDNTIYHQLVSNCLDTLELVFNFQRYRQAEKNLIIRRWNVVAKLQELKNNPKHHLLGSTLELFLNPESTDNTFYGFTDVFLIYYNYQIIAATSPFTLVFTLPDLGDVHLNSAKGYRLYQKPFALPDRPDDFQIYLHKLFLAYPELKSRMASMYEYVTLAKSHTPEPLRSKLNELQFSGDYGPSNFLKEYIPLVDETHSAVTIRNVQLGSVPAGNQDIADRSDFVIEPTLHDAVAKKPLVLKEGHYPGWTYVSGAWQQDTKVPIKNKAVLESRILPGLSDKYPFITIGDFLEDYLIELPYELNTNAFNYGQVQFQNGAEREKELKFPYLLPIKREYFDYFNYRDLDKFLKIIIDPEYVKVQLTVPVRRGTIVFERRYYENPQNPKDEHGNVIPEKGKIIKAHIGLGVFPFIKFNDPQYNDFYKIMLVDLDTNGMLAYQNYDLRFYLNKNLLRIDNAAQGVKKTKRVNKEEASYGSTYYEVYNTYFDFFELVHPASVEEDDEVKGLAIPKWTEISKGTKAYTFAIDFGTTNTHIAYTDNNYNAPSPFTIEEKDMQVVMLNKPADDPGLQPIQKFQRASLRRALEIDMVLNREFVPYLIGGEFSGAETRFPIRTTTCELSNFTALETDMLGNINVGFGIAKELEVPSHTTYQTNLKWNTELDAKGNDRIDVFFRELLRLIKHKVALNDGVISQTRLIWFAPLSLDVFAFNLFEEKWVNNFQRVFKTDRKPEHLTESAAPFYYLQAAGEVVPARNENLLNVDIGGGSTDILLFVSQKPAYGSSFRFAGDSLWGDGFNRISNIDNGFLLTYQKLSDKPFRPKSISRSSADVFNDIFNSVPDSVYTNVFIRARYLRVLFYLHYTAVIYHCAQIIKGLNVALPRYITFSGKGSLYLNLLTGGSNLSSLERLTKVILEEVTREKLPDNFTMIRAKKPKEATANGGVFYRPDVHETDRVSTIRLLGDVSSTDISDNNIKLKDIDPAMLSRVAENVRHYFDLVLSNDKLLSFFDDFAIEADLEPLRKSIESKIDDGLHIGIDRLQDRRNVEEKPLPETLFFYPIRHIIYTLSKEIYQQHYAQ